MLDFDKVFTSLAGNKDAIIAEAVSTAKIASGVATPLLSQIQAAALAQAEAVAKNVLRPGCAALLDNAVTMFQLTVGPRPDDEVAAIDWRDQFDTHLLDTMGADITRAVSQDFIGEWCTDSDADEPEARMRMAQVMAERLVDAAKKGRTAGQVLSEIGIVTGDLQPFAAPATPDGAASAAAEMVIPEPQARARVEQVVGKYAITLGMANLDPAKLSEILTLCFDDDDFLPLTPLKVIGGGKEDLPYFRAYLRAAPVTCIADTVAAAFTAAMSGVLVETPKLVSTKKVKIDKKGATDVSVEPPSVPAAAVAPAVPSQIGTPKADYSEMLKLLRTHASDNDTELGAMIGKTRGTVSNIGLGKAPCPLTPAQIEAFKAHIALRLAGLQAALDMLG